MVGVEKDLYEPGMDLPAWHRAKAGIVDPRKTLNLRVPVASRRACALHVQIQTRAKRPFGVELGNEGSALGGNRKWSTVVAFRRETLKRGKVAHRANTMLLQSRPIPKGHERHESDALCLSRLPHAKRVVETPVALVGQMEPRLLLRAGRDMSEWALGVREQLHGLLVGNEIEHRRLLVLRPLGHPPNTA